MQNPTTRQLVSKLAVRLPRTTFLNKIKIIYRPYICPITDLLPMIPPNSSVYDIGCGSGMFLLLVAEYRNPIALAGIEINKELIKNASELLQPYPCATSLHWYDGLSVPDDCSHFHCVTMIDVFHHIPKDLQEEYLWQLYAKMKPGALFLFKDIDSKKYPWVWFNKLHDLVLNGETGNEWGREIFLELAHKIGFVVLQSTCKRTLVYPHFTFLFKKPELNG